MDLDMTLSLGRSDLVVGESTSLAMVFTNVSRGPLSLPDPANDDRTPKIRVREVASKRDLMLRGAGDRERETSHEFVPLEPPEIIELPPRAQVKRSADLLQWLGPLPPGKYELSLVFDYGELQASSPPVPLNVAPLQLVGASTAGAHSGSSPIRYAASAARTGKGSAILLSSFTFDEDGHANLGQSLRAAELDYEAHPVLSVTPNKFAYPAHWLAWLHGDGLASMYVKQGKVETPPRTHPLDAGGSARLIAPLLLDLTGSDGSQPGRGIVALWVSGGAGSRLRFYVLEPDGSLAAAESVPLEAGELRWARALALSNGERRVYLAIQREARTEIECVQWGAKSAARIATFPGQLIGAGVSLNMHDAIYGAAVVREQSKLRVHRWQVDSGGSPGPQSAFDLISAGDEPFDTALVGISPTGKVNVLPAAANRWFWMNANRVLNPLPDSLAKFGTPLEISWVTDVSPMVMIAGAQDGITYQPLAR